MNTIVEIELKVDVQDAYDYLDRRDKAEFLAENISDLSDVSLLEEIERRGLYGDMAEMLSERGYTVTKD